MRLILAIALAAFLALTPAEAHHCATWSTSEPEITVGTPYGTYYVDNDACQPGCLFSVWPYEESNGIPGLQRGDEVVDDTCHGMIPADGFSG